MDYNLVLQNVSRHITLDKEEISYFTSLLSYKEIRAKRICVASGRHREAYQLYSLRRIKSLLPGCKK